MREIRSSEVSSLRSCGMFEEVGSDVDGVMLCARCAMVLDRAVIYLDWRFRPGCVRRSTLEKQAAHRLFHIEC